MDDIRFSRPGTFTVKWQSLEHNRQIRRLPTYLTTTFLSSTRVSQKARDAAPSSSRGNGAEQSRHLPNEPQALLSSGKKWT